MNCPRCGSEALIVVRTRDGGVLTVCHACTSELERAEQEQQTRDRIRDAVIERAVKGEQQQQRKAG